jgi:AcrR family transcriptional regulator
MPKQKQLSTLLPKQPKMTPRRTQAVRSETTRAKVIDAAIDLLVSTGHAATTPVEVARRARVSRGALLHQFPTRTSMLLAVARHILAEQSKFRRERIVDTDAGKKRFYSAVEISWDVEKQPAARALLEIMLASRSDRALRESFGQIIQFGDELRREAAKLAAGDLGIDDIDAVDDMLLLHLTTLRGLAIQLMFGRSQETVERIRKLFTLYERRYAADLMEKQKEKKSP